jgi:hypothetical protein
MMSGAPSTPRRKSFDEARRPVPGRAVVFSGGLLPDVERGVGRGYGSCAKASAVKGMGRHIHFVQATLHAPCRNANRANAWSRSGGSMSKMANTRDLHQHASSGAIIRRQSRGD